jgi:rfaE bifunctional protein nucleotidyltransferase chain/domain
MTSLLSLDEAYRLADKLRSEGKQITLAGGCFDLLHIGHIYFFGEAKKSGDILMVLIESDEKVRQLKGDHRPVHTQKERAELVAAIRDVDYVVLLPMMNDHDAYDSLVVELKPAIIATTVPDIHLSHKKRQADMVGARLYGVPAYRPGRSTTALFDAVHKEL